MTLHTIDWLNRRDTPEEYNDIKKAIADICYDVSAAGCIDEICIHDIVQTFYKHGYIIQKGE